MVLTKTGKSAVNIFISGCVLHVTTTSSEIRHLHVGLLNAGLDFIKPVSITTC